MNNTMWGIVPAAGRHANKRTCRAESKMNSLGIANAERTRIEQRIRELGKWFHNMNLRGVQTAPNHFLGDYPRVKWERFAHALPADLSGKSVLDIGCNAGFYAIEMKRRGAERVIAIDEEERYLAQGRFAAELNNANIEFQQLSVYDVDKLDEKFDLVLFLGVLYHLRYPLLALDLMHEHVVNDVLVFQSMQRGTRKVLPLRNDYDFWETDLFGEEGFPIMYFIENRYAGDGTNWWIPNRACVEAMLRSAGFTITEHPEEEVYICRRSDLPDDLRATHKP
jgi:tRNA (mo5U34)-methyltransferase